MNLCCWVLSGLWRCLPAGAIFTGLSCRSTNQMRRDAKLCGRCAAVQRRAPVFGAACRVWPVSSRSPAAYRRKFIYCRCNCRACFSSAQWAGISCSSIWRNCRFTFGFIILRTAFCWFWACGLWSMRWAEGLPYQPSGPRQTAPINPSSKRPPGSHWVE